MATAAIAVLGTALGGSFAEAGPIAPLSHSGRWITDAKERVAILHGVNMVAKRPPYTPSSHGFGEDDAAFLQRNGFDAVRLGLIYAGVEPAPGSYDDAYLDQIAAT
jgi:endoglycosylceramidase